MSEPIPTFGEPEPGVEYVLRPGAYVLLFNREGRVAVVRDGSAHYLPGGGLDPGESPEQGAVRECREECALGVRIVRHLGTADDLFHNEPERTHFRKRCAYFLGEVLGPIAGVVPEHELLWLPREKAREILTHGSQRWAVGLVGSEQGGSMHRCPRCGEETHRGGVFLRPNPLDFFRLYLSNVTYVPDSEALGGLAILRSADRRVAYRCYRCGVVILTPTPWTPA